MSSECLATVKVTQRGLTPTPKKKNVDSLHTRDEFNLHILRKYQATTQHTGDLCGSICTAAVVRVSADCAMRSGVGQRPVRRPAQLQSLLPLPRRPGVRGRLSGRHGVVTARRPLRLVSACQLPPSTHAEVIRQQTAPRSYDLMATYKYIYYYYYYYYYF